MKKIISLIISVCVLAGVSAYSAAPRFTDTDGHWAEAAIEKWSGYDVIHGSDNRFRPDDSITRGETAVVLDGIMGFSAEAENTFSDLDTAFYTAPMLRLCEAGIMSGDQNRIYPKDNLTREEAAVILCKAFNIAPEDSFEAEFADSSSVSGWAVGYMAALANKKYLNGIDGFIRPCDNITRAQLVYLTDSIVGTYFNKSGEYSINTGKVCIVNASDVRIKDSSFSDLIISAKSDEVYIGSTVIDGTLSVNADTRNAVRLSDCTVKNTDFKNFASVTIETPSPSAAPVITPSPSPSPSPVITPSPAPAEEEEEIYGGYIPYPEETEKEKDSAVLCVEAFTVGGGYVAPPEKAELREGVNAAEVLDQYLRDNNLKYTSSGSLESGFYLSRIEGIPSFSPSLPPALSDMGIDADLTLFHEGELGEFDFTQESGWMYCINGVFPDAGLSDLYLHDGDVLRVQFTLAFGADIGNAYNDAPSFETADRDALTRLLSEKGLDAAKDYMDIITKPDASQSEIDNVCSLINKGV